MKEPQPNSPAPAVSAQDMAVQGHIYSRKAGYWVSIASALFVAGLIALLFYQVYLQNQQIPELMVTQDEALSDRLPDTVRLELELQRYRASRAESALLFRHIGSVAGVVVSLTMVVLGSILVFDRVYAAGDGDLNLTDGGKLNLQAKSGFPGYLLTTLGAATLVANMLLFGPWGTAMVTRDIPVFVRDENPERYGLKFYACLASNTTAASTQEACGGTLARAGDTPVAIAAGFEE